MRFLTALSFILLSVSVLVAQQSVDSFDYIDLPDSTVLKTHHSQNNNKKMQFGTNLGLAYTINSAGYGGLIYSLSPNVSYSLTDKLSLSGGISLGYGSFYIPYLAETEEEPMMQMTQLSLYLSGDYSLSEKLTVSGLVYKQLLDVPNPNALQYLSNYNAQGMAIGMQYKITPNVSFGAQIRYETPGLYNPNMFSNPYDRMNSSYFW